MGNQTDSFVNNHFVLYENCPAYREHFDRLVVYDELVSRKNVPKTVEGWWHWYLVEDVENC